MAGKKKNADKISEDEFKRIAAQEGFDRRELEDILAEFFPDQDSFSLEDFIAALAARV